ncbi:cobalamin-independent methionine synthase II family protein [Pseudonocardia asaccharolytica]|uniref:Methionine synthase n=1 Tax=Pseudonocardia asaccharolytica DSM 44247 = NBRC 16224 TaxID=1123024 RepID=A0A511D5F2_9PSEU|nr:cobalamin-independent methionine synthase II family protein [Pseudonocardia asaccharolytica]GEL19877.1 methionine synthase [Pseudonocardia asaccharolytica DSM 44247 = NBRC 16224]
MKTSSDAILTTHTGSLPRPDRLAEIHKRRQADEKFDEQAFRHEIEAATVAVVSRQAEIGVSVVSDGEMSKGDYIDYVSWRLGGFGGRTPADSAFYFSDMLDTPELIDFTYRDTNFKLPVCVEEVSYTGHDLVQADITGLRAAIEKSPHQPAEAFLPAVAPGLIAMCFTNRHYSTYEDYVWALAEAMAVEYRAIVDAGFLLQIDAPDLAFGADFFTWMRPEIDRLGLRGFQELSVAAMNRALEGIPAEKVRVHLCWANYMGLHVKDLPLRDVLEPAFGINAMAIGFEAANPAHMHEWQLFEEVAVPNDKVIMPGVIDTKTHVVEHPELVAERIVRYVRLVGKEKVIPGTDCGFGTFVGLGTVHPQAAWRKLESLARGAEIATRRLARA